MKNIVLIGGAGAPNYGDELIVKGWIDFFKNNLPESKVTFFENIADKEKKLHGETNLIKFSDSLVKVAKGYTVEGFWKQVLRGYDFIDNGGVEKYSHLDLSPLLEADIVHLHGGGYLNNYDPEKGFYIGLLASLKEKYEKKIFATGIGFGPVPSPHDNHVSSLNYIFSLFDVFELRDVDNYRWLKARFHSGHFLYGLDDCYLFKNSDLVELDNTEKRLYLSFLLYNSDKISKEYWKELKKFSNQFDKIIFFESYPWQDKKTYELLKEKFPTIEKLNIEKSLHQKLKIGAHDFAVCARFHVHFILSRSNVAGVYSRDSKYYNVKHQSILDRGSEMLFSDFSEFTVPVANTRISYLCEQDRNYHAQKIDMCKALYSAK